MPGFPVRLPRASFLRAPVQHVSSSRFSTSSQRRDYADTLPNLRIGAHTKVLFQGFTGGSFMSLSIDVRTF